MNLVTPHTLTKAQSRLFRELVDLHLIDNRVRKKMVEFARIFISDLTLPFNIYFKALLSFWLSPEVSGEDKKVAFFLKMEVDDYTNSRKRTKRKHNLFQYSLLLSKIEGLESKTNFNETLADLCSEITVSYTAFRHIVQQAFVLNVEVSEVDPPKGNSREDVSRMFGVAFKIFYLLARTEKPKLEFVSREPN